MSARDDLKVRADLIDLVLGECLGSGISRDVFVFAPDERIVVKLERAGGGYFSNVREWNIWNAASGLDWAQRWLAKPLFISDNGRVLLMERTATFAEGERTPKKLPAWLTDFKPENYGWGLISGNFVCHDYASDIVTNNSFTKRLRAVKWRTREANAS